MYLPSTLHPPPASCISGHSSSTPLCCLCTDCPAAPRPQGLLSLVHMRSHCFTLLYPGFPVLCLSFQAQTAPTFHDIHSTLVLQCVVTSRPVHFHIPHMCFTPCILADPAVVLTGRLIELRMFLYVAVQFHSQYDTFITPVKTVEVRFLQSHRHAWISAWWMNCASFPFTRKVGCCHGCDTGNHWFKIVITQPKMFLFACMSSPSTSLVTTVKGIIQIVCLDSRVVQFLQTGTEYSSRTTNVMFQAKACLHF